jgi:hypothetical protein
MCHCDENKGEAQMMLKHWWTEHRWILTKKILYTIDCILILLLPFMHSPYNYVIAVSVVITLAVFFRDLESGYRRIGSER